MTRLESEAFAIEEDALDDLEKAAKTAKLAAGNARSDLSNAGDRLGGVSLEARDKSAFSLRDKERWIGGHILAQVADARLGKAWIHYERYVAHSRNAVVLDKFGEMLQLREADSAMTKEKPDRTRKTVRTMYASGEKNRLSSSRQSSGATRRITWSPPA